MIHATRDKDRTIFFSSHLLDDVERTADYIAILDRSVLRACCPIETFRSSIRQFVLHYDAPVRPPDRLPDLRGLLQARRTTAELRLTIVRPDGHTRRHLRELGASSIEDVPVSFDEAVIGYIGERGEQYGFLDGIDESAVPGGVR
jgi:ABC-2 type transport system ATP-binding protein